MNRLREAIFVTLAAANLLVAGPSFAWELTTHDLKPLGQERYQVTGEDPYLLFERPTGESATDGLWLELELLSEEPIQDNRALHIYWANQADTMTAEQLITSEFELGSNRFVLPLEKLGSNGKAVRLDIERCGGCVVKAFTPIGTQGAVDESAYPSGFDVFSKRFQGENIAVSDWFGEELREFGNGAFGFKSWDPRVINTTLLGIPIDSIAGIYFEFDYNNAGDYHSYELFWYLQGLPWSGLRSAHFVLENTGDNRKQVFLPFDRIHSKRKLNHLRFDFEACPTCRFQLIETRLVGRGEQEKFTQHIPQRLYYVHTEPPPAAQIKSDILRKMRKDWGFFLAWTLLLLSSIAVGVWRFRRVE